MPKTYLCLEDGEIIEGEAFGYVGASCGEVVFSTAMTGYCQSLTDPSFAGQLLVFTYPLIGNYGVPALEKIAPHLMANFESERIWVAGAVVSSDVETPSHYQMAQSLSEWLRDHRVAGIAHVDTRALTQKIREKGCLRGVITPAKRFEWNSEPVANLVQKVSLPNVTEYAPKKPNGKRVLLLDCGVKHGILLLQVIIPKLEQKEREKLSNDMESLLREALKDSDRVMGLVDPPTLKCGLEKIKVEEPK